MFLASHSPLGHQYLHSTEWQSSATDTSEHWGVECHITRACEYILEVEVFSAGLRSWKRLRSITSLGAIEQPCVRKHMGIWCSPDRMGNISTCACSVSLPLLVCLLPGSPSLLWWPARCFKWPWSSQWCSPVGKMSSEVVYSRKGDVFWGVLPCLRGLSLASHVVRDCRPRCRWFFSFSCGSGWPRLPALLRTSCCLPDKARLSSGSWKDSIETASLVFHWEDSYRKF